MAIQTLYDTGSDYEIDPKYDGAVYSVRLTDCVISGIGDEFTAIYDNESAYIHFNAGSEAVIGGAFFKITSYHDVALPANLTNVFLCASISPNGTNGSRGSFQIRSSESAIQKGNINGSGSTRDLVLYQFSTNSSGVITSITDKRAILGSGADQSIEVLTTAPTANYTGSGYKIVYLTSAPVTKYSGYIYLIKE